MERLSRSSLRLVPVESRPLVVAGEVGPGIVHLGLGAFHRAHQAVYTEEAIAAAGGDWAVIAVAPRSRALVDALDTQDHLFSVTSAGAEGSVTRIVGALAGARHAPSDPRAVVALLADPAVRVVTLSVTEKAYLLDRATGRLRVDDTLRAELTGRTSPATVPALLARGLIARARADAGPVALVSCDNLPSNGRRLRDVLTDALAAAGEGGDWVAQHVRFPGTMVDRIVPATTAATLDAAAAALGVSDHAAVVAEPYREWVIEDDFPAGRPAWEAAGAVLTHDAKPYERLKLRTLNGVHSALAYLGALAGSATIAEALALPGMREVMERFVADDIAPSLVPPEGVSVVDYGRSVLDRFANPAIGHSTLQVAMDGSQKLPQRILHTVADRRAAGAQPRWAALMVAGWMRFACGGTDDGTDLPLDDPLAEEIRAAAAAGGGSAAATVKSLLTIDQVFPLELAEDTELRDLVAGWLGEIDRHGVAGLLAGLGAES